MTAPAAPAPVTETLPEAIPAATPPEPTPAAALPAVPVAVAPETPPEARRPLTRNEARARVIEAASEAEVAPSAEAPAVVETPPGAEAALAATVPAPTAEPAKPLLATPPRPIPIEVPLGHPVREMGVERFMASSPQEERAVRALLNSYVRRQELATAQAEVAELKREKIGREARETALQKWTSRPEYAAVMAKAQEIRESFGEAEAQNYLRGANADLEGIAQQELDARMGELEEQDIVQHGQRWKNEAWLNVNTLPEAVRSLAGFPQWFEKAVQSFDSEIELGHYPQIRAGDTEAMHKEFMRFFGAQLTREADVVGVYRMLGERDQQNKTAATAQAAAKEREIAEIKRLAVEEHMKQLAAKGAQRPPPNPLGNLNAGRERISEGSQAAAPAAPQSPQSPRKLAKAGAMERVRERFGP